MSRMDKKKTLLMYNPGLVRQEQHSPDSSFARMLAIMRSYATLATPSNSVGVVCALFAIVCLLALPEPWNIRIPLYLTVVIWTVVRPRVALYLLPFAIPWGSLDTINVGLSLTSADILVLLLIGSWLLSFPLRPLVTRATRAVTLVGPLDHEEAPAVPRYLIASMLLLFLTMLLSMIDTQNITSSIKELSKWLEFLAVILLGSQYLRTRRQIWTLVIIACLAGVSQALYGYVQYFFNIGPQAFVRDAGLRVYGTFGQPNPYAGYINMSLAIVIALMLLGRNWATRILAGMAVVLLGAVEYLSQSRGGEIAITVAILFIITVGMPRLRKLIAAGAIGALAVIAAYLGGIVPERLLLPILRILGLIQISFTSPSSQDFSTAERLAHWIAGIGMFTDHPFTGVGIGNYGDAYAKYHITIFVNSLGHAHNYYINMAAETGFLGLTAFLLFLLSTFVAGGRAYRSISKQYNRLKTRWMNPQSATTATETRETQGLLGYLTNDRALAIGLLAALLSVCTHNLVDNLYVHSMTILFALLLIALIRLERVARTVL